MGRQIIVGDIHGCIDEFDELLHKVQYEESKDELISAGDFLDRGPNPAAVVGRFRRLRNSKAVRGNHEDKYLGWLLQRQRLQFDPTWNPPKPIFLSRLAQERNSRLTDEDVAWLKALPPYLRISPKWLVLHGGIRPNVPMWKQKTDDLVRIRYLDEKTLQPVKLVRGYEPPPNSVFWTKTYSGHDNIIYGHSVFDLGGQPRVDKTPEGYELWGIDTGCCFGGRLTALILPEREIVQVTAHAEYARWKPKVKKI